MAKIDLDYFEKIIFQNCLKKDSTYLATIVEYLDRSLFKNTNIASIVGIIKDFFLERGTIPTVTELKARINTAELKSNLKEAINDIKPLDKDYNEDELVHNTEYFLKQRKFGNFLEDAVDKKINAKEFDLESAQKEAELIHSISLIDDLGLDYFGENERVVEYLLETDKFVSTGYTGLDKALGGGLFREGRCIYGIGGETNVGKSIFLANICVNILLQQLEKQEDVVIISLEMSEKRYAKRISGILTGIALASLSERIDNYKEYIADFKSKYQKHLIIKEFAAKSVSAKNIFAYISKLQRKKDVKSALIAIDYAPLQRPSITQHSKHSELQYIIQETRGLSYVFECPIVTPAQLNRLSHKAESPGLDNVSGSWDMLSDFDGFATLWQTDMDREQNLLRYGGKKVRDGAKGNEGALLLNPDTLRLTEEDAGEIDALHKEKKFEEIIYLDSIINYD